MARLWSCLCLASACCGWSVCMIAEAGAPTASTIETAVAAHTYTWTLHNSDDQAITRFAIDLHHGHDPKAPLGWTLEVDGDRFVAQTADPLAAIAPGEAAAFSARFSSYGAVLGLTTATIGFADGSSVELSNVQAPVAPPPARVWS